MIFSKENWTITADPNGATVYNAVMRNTVVVRPAKGGKYKVYIHAPGGVLPLLHNLVRSPPQEFIDRLRQQPLKFYLDQHQSIWIFGCTALGEAYDLWPYASLPFWGRRSHEA